MKKLSPYTIASNCTDITDCNDGISEIFEAYDNYKRNKKKEPEYLWKRLEKLEDKRDKFSMKEHGMKYDEWLMKKPLTGVATNKPTTDSIFLAKKIRNLYLKDVKMDLAKAKAIAHQLDLKLSENELMQACEVAVVMAAREIAQSSESLRVRYEKIRDLYEHQITIKPKDGQARFLQQFSTPAPLAFLAGEFVNGVKQPGGTFGRYFLEPSAGNGMLTIALNNYSLYVNELDEVRYNNLKNQGFNVVTNEDATKMQVRPHYFSGVITNPPFAELKKEDYFRRKGKKGGKDIEYVFTKLDFKLSILALENMADYGRAAIIVGGKLASKVYSHEDAYWNKMGILYGEFGSFLNYLNRQYNLVDILYISGNLYEKQGTTFPIVMLLIDGRKQWDDRPNSVWHQYDIEKDAQIKTFSEYFNRMFSWIEKEQENNRIEESNSDTFSRYQDEFPDLVNEFFYHYQSEVPSNGVERNKSNARRVVSLLKFIERGDDFFWTEEMAADYIYRNKIARDLLQIQLGRRFPESIKRITDFISELREELKNNDKDKSLKIARAKAKALSLYSYSQIKILQLKAIG